MYGRPPGPASVAQNHVQQGHAPMQNVGTQGPMSNIPLSQNHVQQGGGMPPMPVQNNSGPPQSSQGMMSGPPVSQNHFQPGMPPMSVQNSATSIGPVPVAKNVIQPGMPNSSMQNSGQVHPSGMNSIPVVQNNIIQPGMPPTTSLHNSGPPQPSVTASTPQNHVQPGMAPPPSVPNSGPHHHSQGLPPAPQNHIHQGMPPIMPVQNSAPHPSGPPSAPQNHIQQQPGVGFPPSSQNPGPQNTPGQQHINQNHIQPGMPPMSVSNVGPINPASVQQNHVQPGMPPMPMPNAAAPGAQIPKRYPVYPQQPPMSGPVAPSQTYPSFPQPPQQQQFQQTGMQMQPQQGQQQDGGYYTGPAGSQYPRPTGTAPAAPQAGMAQGNYQQYGQQQQQPAQYGQVPAAPAYAQPSAQQGQKRLDPDQMPSAIGVMQEDQQTRGGIFRTDQKGLLPPLVTTKFQVEDFGNASPRFVRSTMYSVPAQLDMLKQTAIPFALVINPFDSPAKDEQPIPCVDLGPMGPVRCIRCKAYMSPLMQFIDGGRRFQCLLCKAITEVPPEYFQHLDHTGQRVDKWERPELWRGTYEYIATAEYCRNNVLPKEPAFVFVIDVSYNNVKSGLVNLLCSQMKNLIESLPTHTPVGFITYNSKVHFYNIDPALGQPQMVIVPDVGDMFMPLLRGFLVPRAEAMDAVDSLMEQIPALFGDTKETEAVLGPAIVAGMEALKASDRVGKLLVFHSSLPTSDIAPGKLKNREADRKLLGTDKEKTVLVPQSTYYNTLGQDCVGAGVSVDLYLFNNSYIDVATVGQVARLTGGSVNKYTYFQADIDGPRVVGDIILHLSRHIGFDSVMRVRTSTGVRPTDFFGHYYMANTTDVELAAIDSQKGIAVEIKHDASITDEDGVYIQVALLYTTIYGQRRLRIHNLALNTCMQMADLYRNCELDTIINFLAKQSISRSVETTPQDLKEGIVKRCAQMLATYRKHCANPSMPGQLILPECLKLLPLYVNCVLRSDAVAGTSEITPDDRSWLMYTVMTKGVSSTVHYFYPQLVPIIGPSGSVDDPVPVRCSRDKLSDDSAFILENGIYIFMWIGAAVNPDWIQDIFGVANLGQINVEAITELPDHVNTDESLRLRAFIRSLRSERQRHMRLTIVRQRDKMELVMNRFLVEDRGTDGQPSYVDFLCHMHKEIRALLNQ